MVSTIPQGKAGHWERHVAFAGGRQRIADVHRCHRRRPAGARLFTPAASSATRRFRRTIRRRPWTFHADLAEARLPAVHARPGRRRRERRRPAATCWRKNGWWEQPARRCEGRVLDVSSTCRSPRPAARRCCVYDVDGDGDNDVVTSKAAHAYGLAWFENVNGDDGEIDVQRAPDHGREARGERVRRRVLAAARARRWPTWTATACWTSSPASGSGRTASTIRARSSRPCCTGSRRCARAARCGSCRTRSTTTRASARRSSRAISTATSGRHRRRQQEGHVRFHAQAPKDVDRSNVGGGAAEARSRRLLDASARKAQPADADGLHRHGRRRASRSISISKRATSATGRPTARPSSGSRLRATRSASARGDSISGHEASIWIGTYETRGDEPAGHAHVGELRGDASVCEFSGRRRRGRRTARRDRPRRHRRGRLHGQRPQRRRNAARRSPICASIVGKEIFVRIVDHGSAGWGHVNFDHFRFHDEKPRSRRSSSRAAIAARRVSATPACPPRKRRAAMKLPDGLQGHACAPPSRM